MSTAAMSTGSTEAKLGDAALLRARHADKELEGSVLASSHELEFGIGTPLAMVESG